MNKFTPINQYCRQPFTLFVLALAEEPGESVEESVGESVGESAQESAKAGESRRDFGR
jgi:hypothetical protein